MAILGRISDLVQVSSNFDLNVSVEYFDDADPANIGVGTGLTPRVVLHRETFPYPPTLVGTDLITALQADIKARGQSFERAWTAANTARTFLTIGSLIPVDG